MKSWFYGGGGALHQPDVPTVGVCEDLGSGEVAAGSRGFRAVAARVIADSWAMDRQELTLAVARPLGLIGSGRTCGAVQVGLTRGQYSID